MKTTPDSLVTLADRLRYLRGRDQLTLKEVARSQGVSAQAVHKWENGGLVEHWRYAVLAKQYGVNESWLITGQLGSGTAAKPLVDGSPSLGVPLLAGSDICSWLHECAVPSVETSKRERILCPAPHGPSTFAVCIDTVSMENASGARSYSIGDIAFADPDLDLRSGSVVIAARRFNPLAGKVADLQPMIIREFIVDGGATYWRACNPAWVTPIEKFEIGDFHLATVIGKWVAAT